MTFRPVILRPARKRILWALLFAIPVFAYLLACEKDDICTDGDTPLLVIRFYDIDDPTVLKTVTNLRVIGLNQSDAVDTFTDRSTTDSIGIPLRVSSPGTSFVFIINSADEDGAETGNRDTLQFTYDAREVFISRACGFVANYENLEAALPTDTIPWVRDIEIVNPEVQDQTAAHVKIYH